MISFTAFKLFIILIVYVWFAVGIAVISVFAIRIVYWFKVPNEHISQSIRKDRENYEMEM